MTKQRLPTQHQPLTDDEEVSRREGRPVFVFRPAGVLGVAARGGPVHCQRAGPSRTVRLDRHPPPRLHRRPVDEPPQRRGRTAGHLDTQRDPVAIRDDLVVEGHCEDRKWLVGTRDRERGDGGLGDEGRGDLEG